MKCPKCKRVSPDSIHCTYCGWQEPLPPVDPSEKSDKPLEARKAPIQLGAGSPAPPENKQPEANPEDKSPAPSDAAEANPEEDTKKDQIPSEPVKDSPQIKANAQPEPDKQVANEVAKKEKGKAAEAPKKEQGQKRDEEPDSVPAEMKKKEKEKLDANLKQYNVVKGDKNILAAELNQLRAKQINTVKGNENTFAENVFNMYGPGGTQPIQEERSYIDLTAELPAKDENVPDFVSEDLKDKTSILMRERVLLISCIDYDTAQAAAYAVIDLLGLCDNKHRRLLNFDKIKAESRELDIYQFLKKKVKAEAETAVLADATSNNAQRFLDSLLDAKGVAYKDIRNDLDGNKLFLVCHINSEKADKRLSNEDSALQSIHWKIPFLQQLLRPYYPDKYLHLEKQILEQREAGRWSKEESDFCRQVKGYLKSGTLLEQIESRNSAAAPLSEVVGFDDDKPVHNTVLYTAAFFPGLSPNEFNRVVSTLLGTQTITINETVNQRGEDGVVRQVEVQKDKLLIQVWRESPDKVLKECKLISSKDTNRAIVFADAGQRDYLKRNLEEEHSLYLQNKFSSLQESGLLFDSSERIANNIIHIIVDMAASYPDYYGRDWVFEIIAKVKAYFESAQTGSDEPILQLLSKSGGLRTEAQVYKRISDLLREMLDDPQVKPIIKRLVEQLMSERFFGAVLNIVKNFRFVPAFDEFRWMRQLLDQGNELIRLQTYMYLYSEIKRMDKQVYQILDELAKWLPAVDIEPQRYSYSNCFALRLMIEYCLDKTSNFDAKNYGCWPSSYPLLFVEDAELAKRKFSLLSSWVFHPGMKYVMDSEDFVEDLERLLPALISEWTFILLGQPQESNGLHDPTDADREYDFKHENEGAIVAGPKEESGNGITAEAAFNILLEQIIEKTEAFHQKGLQREMLLYWEEMKDFLATVIGVFGYTNRNQRKEFIWKRNLLRKLLSQFRSLQKDLKALRLQKVGV